MSTPKLFRQLLVTCTVLIGGVANATSLTLPEANALSAGTYNNFSVYSLNLLKQCSDALDPRCLPTSGLTAQGGVQSGPGQIADQAVVLAHDGGASNFISPFATGSAVDDVFQTPTGNGPNASSSYTMVDGAGAFAGDLSNRWDISLSLLQGYLGLHDLVFLFDNNQRGNGVEQFINVWGQARIVDAAGHTVNGLCFEISTGNAGCSDTGPNPTPIASDYLPVVSGFCVNHVSGAAYAPGAGGCDADDYLVNNNVSTSNAEFAAFNKALNDAAKNINNGQYFLSLNIKYSGNNAGAEQLWICSTCDIGARSQQVPEPSPVALFAIALLGLGLVRSRANKQN
ncbi:MAG: PEP-CTERM sorting domain-containing protein [Pseudomonadota bacterium]